MAASTISSFLLGKKGVGAGARKGIGGASNLSETGRLTAFTWGWPGPGLRPLLQVWGYLPELKRKKN